MNIVLVIIDSLRQDHVGAYGNDWIHTPHLDAFARESTVFTRCYPESLPTLPVRRALHTGIRTFPYSGHRSYKGDFVGAPGWGPIPEEQDTLSELLGDAGFRTAFITDTYHQFKPSKNFHRGFDEWVWIRGQENDGYKSAPLPSKALINSHIPKGLGNQGLRKFLTKYYTNNAYRISESDYYPARLFTEAARWAGDNADARKFFLVVDSFDPHEPWDPPAYYRRLYDPKDDCVDVVQSLYGTWKGKLTKREVKRLQANYAGEVTLVDRWFGHFMEALAATGRLSDTVVAVISDHGHNVGLDPQDKGFVSKQGHPMTRAVADLVMMVRHPDGRGAGVTSGALCYNLDLSATLLSLAGVKPRQPIDGVDLSGLLSDPAAPLREYVTIGWGPLVTVIDDTWWYNATIWGDEPLLFRWQKDRKLEENLAAKHPRVCEKMRLRAVADAGGEIPDTFRGYLAVPGCTPYIPED